MLILIFAVCLWHKSYFPTLCIIWAMPCENVSSVICGQRRPRSASAPAQSAQGLRCSLSESMDTIVNHWRAKAQIRHAPTQDVVPTHIVRMLKGSFSLKAVHII